ncbi:hypothetical protein ACWZJV_25465 [Nocardioides sp. WG-D5]
MSAAELATLTPPAREAIEQRQRYIELGTAALPWFLLVGCLFGLSLSGYGVIGWAKRQAVADELEDIARDRGKTELRHLSDSERITRLERESEILAAEANESDAAVASGSPATEGPLDAGSVSRGPSSARTARAFQRTIEAELQLAVALEELLGTTYSIDLGVEVRRGEVRYEFDLVATARSTGQRYVFELKYLSVFGKNYRSALSSGISTAAAGASLLGESAVAVVVVVYEEDPGEELRARAQAYADQIAGTFKAPPRVAFLSLEALSGADLSPLTRALEVGTK